MSSPRYTVRATQCGYGLAATGYGLHSTGCTVPGTQCGYTVRGTGYTVRGTGYTVPGTQYTSEGSACVLHSECPAAVHSGCYGASYGATTVYSLEYTVGIGAT